MPGLDTESGYLVRIGGGGEIRYSFTPTLRQALTRAVHEEQANDRAVTIIDHRGRRFSDLQLWAEFTLEWRKRHDEINRYDTEPNDTITNWF